VGGALAADGADPSVPRFEAAYAAQTRGFAQAILDDRPVDVPGSAGAAALAIALAAARSMREGRPVAL
jgi:myo-inositol 2-dehydrogenase/D-chiro-inositol 1-dehydrogenase